MKTILSRKSKVSEEEMATEEGHQQVMLDLTGMRMVSLYGDLDEKKANEIVGDLFAFHEMKEMLEKQLKAMDAKTKKQVQGQLAHKDPVSFVISTFGGNAVDMFGIHDAMKTPRHQKLCVC